MRSRSCSRQCVPMATFLGIRASGMPGVMKLVTQGDERLNGLLHHGLLGESGPVPWLEIDLEQLWHY